MREQLIFQLENFSGLNSLISGRAFAQRAPTSALLPYVTLTVDGLEPDYDQDGEDGYHEQIFTINSNGATLRSAVDVANQVKAALKLQQIDIGDTGNKQFLYSVTFLGEIDNFDLFNGSQSGVRFITQTYSITFKEA